MSIQEKALVTGASRGLGRAIAIELVRRGYHVIAGVRQVAPAQADLAQAVQGLPGTLEVQAIDVAKLGDYRPPADLKLLVNNAGFRGRYMAVEDSDLDEWRQTFETNLFGMIALSQGVIPGMRAAGGGIICNIGSLGAYNPMPFYSTYRASKLAMMAVSEALRVELAPFGIQVVDIPIGGVDTDMMRTSLTYRPPDAWENPLYRPMAEKLAAMTGALKGTAPPSEVVAKDVVDEIFKADGPLRRPCDPNARGAAAAGMMQAEEERLKAAIARFC